MHDWSQHWFMSDMGFIWIPFLVLSVWMLFRFLSKDKNVSSKNESAMEILERRYAEGEINTEEFEERKKALNAEK
ncbi:MAG: SHOCT domain-containing protein [Bacteroidetes bacterium]|nr:SHOCT domain-containing protein [Bacteroidota bacterium]